MKWTKLVTQVPINNALASKPNGFVVFIPNLAPQKFRKQRCWHQNPTTTFEPAIKKIFATEKGLYVLVGKFGRCYQRAQSTKTKTELPSVLSSTNLGVK
ncbi:unnamed protein product [Blumeria hordei]|uniref:Uncharacterized protein n=1 Tax=Blumeria hordei TaxID=2867405 RepID=A0A383URI1_BLUHO|nr:unnamed protein product [Blumeria hordei]